MNGAATRALDIGSSYRWARVNLFNSWFSALLTVAIVLALVRLVPPIINWAVLRASVNAPNIGVCHESGGACWAFITDWYRFLLFGRFPYDQQWRPAAVIVIFVALLLASCDRRLMGRGLAVLWILGLACVGVLMWGGVFGMPLVETDLVFGHLVGFFGEGGLVDARSQVARRGRGAVLERGNPRQRQRLELTVGIARQVSIKLFRLVGILDRPPELDFDLAAAAAAR